MVADRENRLRELIEDNNELRPDIWIQPDFRRWKGQIKLALQGQAADSYCGPLMLDVDFGAAMKRAGLRGPFDPNSVRVASVDVLEKTPQGLCKCQFEPCVGLDPLSRPKGKVYWYASEFAVNPGAYWLLFNAKGTCPHRKPPGSIWGAAQATGQWYRAEARDGVLSPREIWDHWAEPGEIPLDGPSELRPISAKQPLRNIIYSSAQTGWVEEEDGKVLAMDVLANGPVRAVVRVKKQLKGGVRYEKTYTFWPGRIDVEIQANKDLGVLSRAYYALGGTYEDSAGNKAKIDGAGQGEGVIGQCPSPKWYAVYTKDWAHSCVALTEFSNLTYWDAGANMGGVGFHGSRAKVAKISYVFHAGQKDASFAKADYERLTHPPTVRLLPEAK